jgi:signal peptidase II
MTPSPEPAPSRPSSAARRLGPIVFCFILILDLASKEWALATIAPVGRIEVTSFFNLVMVWNHGISFGMLQTDGELGRWLLIALALAICVILVFWLRKEYRLPPTVAIWLILAGAIGNVIDRVRHGAVVDFLDFHAFGYHWPAFNVADSSIVVGAVILVVDSLFGDRRALGPEGKEK